MNVKDPRYKRSLLVTWAMERRFDLEHRELENSLDVGPNKALGSWGVPQVGGLNELRVLFRAYARIIFLKFGFWNKNYNVLVESTPTGVWNYLWYRPALAKVIDAHLETLRLAGSPWLDVANLRKECLRENVPLRYDGSLKKFVEVTRSHKAVPCTKLFDCISDAYGDKLNPGRSDLDMDVTPEEMFAVFLEIHGFPDPAGVFFAEHGWIVPGWSREDRMF